MAQYVTLMDYFQMFSSSNLGLDIDYSKGNFRIFPQFPLPSIRIILYIKQDDPFHILLNLFIINTPTSCNLIQ